ncbi:MAG TPA: alpha/beta hydrolase [Geobacteraceae bacterium]
MVAILRIGAALAAAYACYGGLVFLSQRAIIYPGRTIRVPSVPPAGVKPLWVETAAGRAEAWFFPAAGVAAGPRPALLFFHGNGEVIDFLPAEAAWLRALGLHVLLVEYPGYGRSTGTPSETAITATAVAAFDLLVGRADVDPGRVVAFGRSLGGGAACALARQRPLAALILQSPFTSTRPFARQLLLPGVLVRDVFDNRRALRDYAGPVLIFHGRRDGIIPFAHGRELAAIARRSRFVPLDCGHNDCPPDGEEFRRTFAGFLVAAGILQAATSGDR